uniref:Uncharacterized protein n=1 Tax=Glossina palpalis gambiensis TaxID=67801 RepID=A0A1B0AL11_9MUSC
MNVPDDSNSNSGSEEENSFSANKTLLAKYRSEGIKLFSRVVEKCGKKLDLLDFAQELGLNFSNHSSYKYLFYAYRNNSITIDENFCKMFGDRKVAAEPVTLSTLEFEKYLLSSHFIYPEYIADVYSTVRSFILLYNEYEVFFNLQNNYFLKQISQAVRDSVGSELTPVAEQLIEKQNDVKHCLKTIKRETKGIKNCIFEHIEKISGENRDIILKCLAENNGTVGRGESTCCVALYNIGENKWYTVRRQANNFCRAENEIAKKFPNSRLVKKWLGVDKSVDLMKKIKSSFPQIKTSGNTIDLSHVETVYDDNVIEQYCKSIIESV